LLVKDACGTYIIENLNCNYAFAAILDLILDFAAAQLYARD
jgi:hypothetical protein